MTRKTLAGIAQIMRWGFIDTDSGGILSDNQVERCPWERIEDAHLLIERMVGDGWHVHVSFISDQQVHLGAFDTKLQKWEFADKPDFPSAVVELFCKVYDIRED